MNTAFPEVHNYRTEADVILYIRYCGFIEKLSFVLENTSGVIPINCFIRPGK